jgi:hypothetical protein
MTQRRAFQRSDEERNKQVAGRYEAEFKAEEKIKTPRDAKNRNDTILLG